MASSIQLLPLNPTKSDGISSQGASDNQPDHHITSKPTHALAGMMLYVQYKQYTRPEGKYADISIASYGMNGLRRLSVIINNGAACKLCHMVQENGMQRHSSTSLTPHTHIHIHTHTHRQFSDSSEREGRERERERRKKGEVAFLTSEPCPCSGQSTKLISSI